MYSGRDKLYDNQRRRLKKLKSSFWVRTLKDRLGVDIGSDISNHIDGALSVSEEILLKEINDVASYTISLKQQIVTLQIWLLVLSFIATVSIIYHFM